jgi:poly(3-hydroxyoctanoate) depolymerase
MTSARERRLWVAGVRLHVRETGDGPPLLLVNGLGTHTAMWRPLERTLTGHRIISFDAPGTGQSTLAPGLLPMGSLAAMLEALLDRLGHDRVDVLGYSFGGAVAQQLARQTPERVRRLVLAATTPGWGGVPGSFTALSLMMTPLRYWSPWFYARTIPHIAGGQARDPRFVAAHGKERLARPPSALGYAGQLATMTSWSSIHWLRQVRVPTLVLCGGDDPLTPPVNSMMLAARLPEARLQVLEDEGHLLLLDEHGGAPAMVHEFLTAPSHEASQAWTTGAELGEDDVEEALRRAGRGAEPWGTVSALYRRAVWRR